MNLVTRFSHLLDWFVPQKLRADAVEAQRARIIVGLALLIGCLLLGVGAFQDHQIEPDHPRIKIQYLAISVLFIGPLLLRLTGSLFVLVLVVALFETIVLMAYTQMTGGLHSSGLFWYPVVPVVSLLYLRPRWGILFLAVLVAHVIYLALSPDGLPTDFAERSTMIGAIVPSILLVLVAMVYVWQEKKALIERDLSEAKYRQLAQSPLQGLIVFLDSEIVLTNEAALQLFGCETQQQLQNRSVYELLEVASSPSRHEKSLTRPDGNLLRLDLLSSAIDWGGKPATQILLQDVTEEYLSKQALEQLNEDLERRIQARTQQIETSMVQLNLASRVARVSYWEWRIDEAVIQFSSGMTDVIGTPAGLESLPVDNFLQIVHDEDRARVVDEAENALSSGASFDVEFRLFVSGTETRWVYARGEAVDFIQGQRASRIAGSLQDFTERKQEEKREFEAQKRESLGAIAAGLAHDFNNILTPIVAYAELIKQRPTGVQVESFADVISGAAERAATLVQQILSYVTEAVGEKREVRLMAMVQETLSLLQPSLPKSVDLVTDLKDLPVVWADPAQFHAILMNLCVNARDAMPDGGVLTVSLREVIEGEQRMAEIKLSDTGTGIDSATQQKIFEPYFTTKSPTRGTGLGLAIVDGLIRDMGGSIRVDSKLERGTTMTLLIPMHELPEDMPLHDFRRTASGQCLKVLVVDDDPEVLEVMRIGLDSMGHNVVAFNSGIEAANYMVQNRDLNLLVIDKDMPVVPGSTLVSQGIAINPEVKIVMVSGRFDDADAESLGVTMTLNKPFTVSQLADVVSKMTETN